MFDILKKPKKANRKAALYRCGSESDSQACDIKKSVGMSNVPLGTGLNFEFKDFVSIRSQSDYKDLQQITYKILPWF